MPAMSELARWAADTWVSLAALVHEDSGLPADLIAGSLDPVTRAGNTSPTDIAGYLWSVVCARDLGLITASDARRRLTRTLTTLAAMHRHAPSGMFDNWYAADTGALLLTWPGTRKRLARFYSAVDNGWLAAALLVVAAAEPGLADRAGEIVAAMRFDAFADPRRHGILRGGFWTSATRRKHTLAAYGPITEPTRYTLHHYGLLNSEPRIASYVGIVLGQLDPQHLTALDAPERTYRGRTVVVTCGGSMFEALSPQLFVPESDWSPLGWGRNHADTVACQREFGIVDRRYGYWGFSPCACPGGGYAEWGVAPIAWLPRGYPSRRRGETVVTPHASALALMHEPDAAAENLRRLAGELGCYGRGGFLDAVGVTRRRTADCHLAIDQAMTLAALAIGLTDGGLRRWFATSVVATVLRPAVRAAMPAPASSPAPAPIPYATPR